jgi:hypothetical protein
VKTPRNRRGREVTQKSKHKKRPRRYHHGSAIDRRWLDAMRRLDIKDG